MKTGDCEKEKWIVFVKIAFLLLIIAECGGRWVEPQQKGSGPYIPPFRYPALC